MLIPTEIMMTAIGETEIIVKIGTKEEIAMTMMVCGVGNVMGIIE